jgi:acyl-CoA thioesterase I
VHPSGTAPDLMRSKYPQMVALLSSRFRRRLSACVLALATCVAGACGGATDRDTSETAPKAAPSAPAEGAAPPSRPKIVALGDSLTAGYGLVETQSYPALLQQKINQDGYEFDVVNAGVSGDTSAGGLRRLEWSLEGDVRVVIVALGGNDGLRGLSVADMRRNITSIVDRSREKGAIVILAGMEAPPNYGQEYATAFRQVFRDVARETRVLFIPFLLDDVAGRSDMNLSDGIHPNARGAAIVAENVWRVLQPVLDQMSSGT